MLILIAESKTMADGQQHVSAVEYGAHTPVGESGATRIVEHLSSLSQSELIEATGLSSSLAAKFRQMLYEFPNKGLGCDAVQAFTGVVFKSLDYAKLTAKAREMCNRDVRVISSLYGLLRPDDVIKPYRLDFAAKAAPGGVALNAFWKKDVTISLVKTVRDNGFTEILNLLPADAAKCIDWKIVKRFCKVWKADFVEISDGGKTKTPPANRLKSARGKLLRQILTDGIESVADLRKITSDDFMCEGTPVYSDHLQFVVAP